MRDLGGRIGARTKSTLSDLEPAKEVEEGPQRDDETQEGALQTNQGLGRWAERGISPGPDLLSFGCQGPCCLGQDTQEEMGHCPWLLIS